MDLQTLPPDLRRLAAEVKDPETGFFGPDSWLWKLASENTLQLAGPYASLMQIAHPHVAAGVAAHSNFRDDPIGRLHRTFHAVHAIVFGTRDQALAAALRTRNIHRAVKGELSEKAGPYEPGSHYHANRADLLLWVHATLVEGSIMAHELFMRPLRPEEKEGLYQDMKLSGRLFGIPGNKFPTDYAAFLSYYKRETEQTLAVTREAHEIAWAIIRAGGWYRLTSPLILLVAAGTLPDHLRRQFGLPWNGLMARGFDDFRGRASRARALTPRPLLYRDAYLDALQRIGAPRPPLVGPRRQEGDLPGRRSLFGLRVADRKSA